MKRSYTAAIIIIGNEILSGRTKDANLPYLAEKLNEAGIQLKEGRVIPDVESEIIDAIHACRTKHDYVFTTGGIGPTHDDITALSVSRAFNLPFVLDERAEALLRAYYKDSINEARLKMAYLPQGAELIDNPVSVAPGFRVENVYVMAGVPKIMKAMLDFIIPTLKGGATVLSKTIAAIRAESELAATMRSLESRYGDVDVGSYPFFRLGQPGTSIVMRSANSEQLEAALVDLKKSLREIDTTFSEEFSS